jgi:hypothetical protein
VSSDKGSVPLGPSLQDRLFSGMRMYLCASPPQPLPHFHTL